MSGFKHKCPMCNFYMGSFKPYGFDLPVMYEKQVVGGGRRDNARCFICGCLDRERLIYMFLKLQPSLLSDNIKVLHFAPETVLRRKLKSIFSNYITADLNAKNVDMTIDMTDIPFPDEHFDLIIANHILEHIPDDKKALNELKRVLKNNTGAAILQVPISLNSEHTYEDLSINTEEGRLHAFGQEDHVRLYGQDYPNKLREAGFDVQVFDWKSSDRLYPQKKNKFGFIEEEKIFMVRSLDS
ncbi:class I SAM-dependent methyltransferase [Alteromonas sp. M12]|uniref:class I SAM-dependent methyltransferase n=1 Tax=Alteromonas sp. M12 TaxID=3135644 RepID=UPI00319E8064